MVLRTQRLRQPDSALVSDFEVKSLMHELKQLSIRLPKICGRVSGLVLFGQRACAPQEVFKFWGEACAANRSHGGDGPIDVVFFSSGFRGTGCLRS